MTAREVSGDVVVLVFGARRIPRALTDLTAVTVPSQSDPTIPDGTVRVIVVGGHADLSATLFFSEPDEYDGGELVVQDLRIKLPAGHLVLYSSGSLHRVEPVTRGARLASFFWVQSLVRQDELRSVLLELDVSIQGLRLQVPDSPELIRLTGIYHNLLRQWTQT